jgi:Trk-type K+ transport system membrane component
LPDGTTRSIDLLTGVTASIANLGNIGPTAALGSIDAGPTGNYFAFSVASKIVMSLLMLIGRVGVFTFIIPFVSAIGMREMNALRRSQQFDADEPRVK